jgi:Ca2+-dependent lipid-binding protein
MADNPNTLFDESKISENEYLTLYQIVVTLKNGIDLEVADIVSSDPYCEVSVSGLTRTSKVVEKSLNPLWNETYV